MKNNSEKHKKLANRYDQRFKIVVARPEFQDDVADFRKKWDIDPANLKTTDSREDWWHKHYENDNKWTTEKLPAYRKELVELRTAAIDPNDDSISYKEYEAREKEVNREKPINAYYADLDDIVWKHKLPPKWRRAVQSYVFSNEPVYRGQVGITVTAPIGGEENHSDEITITIDAYTTKQDLMDYWSFIKFHQDHLRHKTANKYQPIDTRVFARNELAYKMHLQGSSYADIATHLTNSVADEEVYSYADVPTMIRNHKKILGIN